MESFFKENNGNACVTIKQGGCIKVGLQAQFFAIFHVEIFNEVLREINL